MKSVKALELDSKAIGALPIVNYFIERLELGSLLGKHVSSRANLKLPHSDTLLIMLKNILLEREPLYEVPEWIAKHDGGLVGLGGLEPNILNDDRIGRSLDALFLADRATIMTELIVSAVKRFHIQLDQFHNDSTTVTVTGEYKAPTVYKGKQSAKLKHGINKDHRPDLKQLLFCLTVSRDGAVPVHCKVYDGNVTDDTTHIQTWEAVRRLAGRSDFTYVADCKLCTRAQMDYLNKEGGKFVTVMPRTRSEDKWFRQWLQSHQVQWSELLRKPKNELPNCEESIYWGFESLRLSDEGYRVLWILSSQKQQLDAQMRQHKVEKTIEELDKLKQRVGSRRLKSKEQINAAVLKVFQENSSAQWFDWKLVRAETEEFKQKGKGRPGKSTEYEKTTNYHWNFEVLTNPAMIQQDAADDGIFPLMTNHCSKSVPMKQVLQEYKYQPYIEKRHEQLKTVLDAAPVYLKLPYRIEALMFLYFIALLINALIERQVRNEMAKQAITHLPLYPEARKCRCPATERILDIFSDQRRHTLGQRGSVLKKFVDPLNVLQQEVLRLLNVPEDIYRQVV